MLEGNVEVFADFRLVRHDLDHVVGEPRRIGVMQADPLDTPDAAQLREQIRQPAAAVEIDPVIGRVLRDDHQFAHAAGGQPPRFVEHLLHRHRDVRPADERNGAVTALPVAPLADFEVGVVTRRREPPLRGQIRPPLAAQRPHDALPVLHAEELVHLGQFGAQLVGIPLRKTSHDEQPVDPTGLLGRGGAQDHVDRLLLGVADEAAGVDHYHTGIRTVAVRRDGIARRSQLRHQVLRVDRILRAAERYDVDLLHPVRLISSRRRRAPRRTHGGRRAATGRCARPRRCNAPEYGTGR